MVSAPVFDTGDMGSNPVGPVLRMSLKYWNDTDATPVAIRVLTCKLCLLKDVQKASFLL